MKVAVAGTFGPLHDGHRALFERALETGDDGVVVALTSDELARETRSEPRPVPSMAERERTVREAVEDLDRWGRDVAFRTLHDELGIASEEPSIDALVVSPETADEVADVNDLRRERGLDPIEGLVVPYVFADDGERISSTRIVAGEIDEHGNAVE